MTNKTPWKIAAIDVDNTLLVNNLISAENHEAVQELIANGIIAVITSGRNYHHVMHIHKALGLGTSPVITSDGALVSIPGGEVISEQPMSPAASTAIASLAAERNVTCLNFFRHGIYVTSKGDWNAAMENHREIGRHYRFVSLEKMARHRVYKTLLFSNDAAAIDTMVEAVMAKHGADVDTIRNAPHVVEFVAKGVSKVHGLEALAAHLGITSAEALAFGDGINDIGMLSWADIGVCLSHGHEHAKSAAKLIVPEGDPAHNFALGVELVLKSIS